jgi:hypothetical protein
MFARARPAALAFVATALPLVAQACACGCGVFDIGAATFLPNNAPSGVSAWFRYSYMNQDRNWRGADRAPAEDNPDKKIETSFYTFGAQYVINGRWSVMAELPLNDRAFTSTDDGTVNGPAGSLYTGKITDIGDLQLTGMYTGFASDLSTGVSFGLKLPTGNYTGPTGALGGAAFDRDSLPGTGSTDLIFGAYHVGRLAAVRRASYFVQGRYQVAVATRNDYRPGDEFNAAAGVDYDLGALGPASKVAPSLQLINSYRLHDTGEAADPLNSGYERVLIAPGLQFRFRRMRVYGDIAFPIYQHVNAAPSGGAEGKSGQLIAPYLLNLQVSYNF